MALRVWLPLNGNLENNGITNISVSHLTGDYDSNGKLGSCYHFTSYAETNFTPDVNNGSLSICGWFKFNQAQIQAAVTQAGTVSSTRTTPSWNIVGNDSYGGVGLICHTNNVYTDGSVSYIYVGSAIRTPTAQTNTAWRVIDFDTWYHLCLVYDKSINQIRLYINGALSSSATLSATFTDAPSRAIRISAGWVFGGNGPGINAPMYANDIRIYDHCLSPKEVKEIAKGLVLHYKLDNIPIQNLNPYLLSTDNYTISDYNGRTVGTIQNGIYHVDGYQSSSSIDTSFLATCRNFITLQSNTDYYLSFYCKAKCAGSIFFGTSGQAYTGLIDSGSNIYRALQQVTLGTEYSGFVCLKLHTGSDTQYKIRLGFDGPNLYGVGSFMEFSMVMLSTSQPLSIDQYTIYGQDIKVPDCSGYKNNGTIVGTATLQSDTSRYNYSTYMAAAGTQYHIESNPIPVSDNKYSVSFWVKAPKVDEVFFADPKMRVGLLTQMITVQPTSSPLYTSTNFTANVWNHIVAIQNGVSFSLYVNGVAESTTSTNNNFGHTANKLYIFNRFLDGPYANYGLNGSISDFRIYSTALSADDVKELYNTSALIHNDGTIEAFEFVETNSGSPEVTKTGLMKAQNIVEYPTLCEYLESDGNAYINTLIPYDSTKNTYKVECKFSMPSSVGTYDGVFGAYKGESYKTLRAIRFSASGMGFYYNDKAGGGNAINPGGSITNIKEIVFTNSSLKITQGGSTATYNYGTRVAATDNNDRTFFLFRCSETSSKSKSRIYYFRLYDGDTLLCDMVPCIYNGAYGMWDKVESKFYKNDGTGSFIIGSVIDNGDVAKLYTNKTEANQLIES